MSTHDTVLERMARLADDGRFLQAIAEGEEGMRNGFVSAALLSLMGTAHAAIPDRESAEACYRRALFLDPENEDALLHLSLLLDERGDAALANRLRVRARRVFGTRDVASR